LGPYVSVNNRVTGYLGGAHGVDDPSASVRQDGKVVELGTLLGPAALKAVKAAVKSEGKRRGGWDNAPTNVDLRATAVRVQPGQLMLEKHVFCCTWAENHNQVEIDAAVPTPKALAPYVPDAQGWFSGAPGCPLAVRVHAGKIELRNGKRQSIVARAPGRLLGVAWVSGKAPALQPWAVDTQKAMSLFKRSRSVANTEGKLGLLEAALQADPGASDVLAEMGWLAFKLGDHRRALAYTRRALEGVIEADADGRIRYNLGRILEAQGEWARARRAYKASLARRINATVQKRLQALSKKGEP
jgi:tetratricopeptide (TPR) repeat protein